MRPLNVEAISASASATTNGIDIPCQQTFYASAQLVASGTAAGTFKMQASNDAVFPPNSPINWKDISNQTVAVSGAGSYLIPKFDVCYEHIRCVYTDTAVGIQTIHPVADVSGSLNSTWFRISSTTVNYYVWLDNGSGIDPAPSGLTSVHITYSNGDSASTLGTSIATALASLYSSFASATGTTTVTVTNAAGGPFNPLSDGTAPTGFTFGQTVPTGTIIARIKTLGA